MTTPRIDRATRDDIARYLDSCQAPILRTIRQFAADELVIPEGKFRNTSWRPEVQPYSALLLDEISTGRWTHTSVVGCVQSGKSLHGFVLPVNYHLFEHCETVIVGAPTMDIGKDKYQKEILPAIRASRYKHLLPSRGAGSRGGFSEEIRFEHGAELKFMSAGGGDAKRSSYTSRVVVMTEVDKMDEAGETSREAAPVKQIENRTSSYDACERRLYEACTVSIEWGRIWTQYQAGTASRIACPCPHCGEHVTPEREHLRGWQEAENKVAAARLAFFVCPICEQPIDDAQRVEMNRRGKLVHRGQSIDRDGTITGEPPETDTLGFRWNAFNNLFWSIGTIAAKEWAAVRADDEEEAEKELTQFYWATPWVPPDVDLSALDFEAVKRRVSKLPRGLVPPDAQFLTVGVDLGKWLAHWIAIAWRAGGSSHIVDYGVFEIASEELGSEKATLIALRSFGDLCLTGFTRSEGPPMVPGQVWIDSGWAETQEVVYRFARETAPGVGAGRFLPSKGYGEGQHINRTYRAPGKKTRDIRVIGVGYHMTRLPKHRVLLVHVNADHYKSQLHERLSMPADAGGAMTLFHAMPNEHTKLAKHFTAEKQVEKQLAGRPPQIVWERIRRANHFLDAAYLATAAGHFVGARVVPDEDRPAAGVPTIRPLPIRLPDAQSY